MKGGNIWMCIQDSYLNCAPGEEIKGKWNMIVL